MSVIKPLSIGGPQYPEGNYRLSRIEVTTNIGCPLVCKACPQNQIINAYQLIDPKRSMMTYGDFKTILTRLVPGGGICFSGFSEPFINKEASKMIKWAFDLGYKVSLFSTLVGMTHSDIDLLKDVKFDEITLHIPDQFGNCRFVINENYINIFNKFSDLFNVDVYSCHGLVADPMKPHLRNGIPIVTQLHDRAGNIDQGRQANTINKGRIICQVGSGKSIGSWTPEVLPDGSLVACCMDYGVRHLFGNLIRQDIDTIANGDVFNAFRAGYLNGNSEVLCHKCVAAVPYREAPAVKVKGAIEQYKLNKKLPSKIISDRGMHTLVQMATADTVCVFGVGKLFRDTYFDHCWDDCLQTDIFCDNDADKWYKTINAIKCIPPIQLIEISNLVVVIFIKDWQPVYDQLKLVGLSNLLPFDNLLELGESL